MIKRNKYLSIIEKELTKFDTILFIVWARQVWKTTILQSLIKYDYIKQEDTVFLSWDKIYNNSLSNWDDFLSYIKTIYPIDKIKYVIIDEAQYIDNISIILKNLIDDIRFGKFSFKIIVSWSGSLNVFKGMSDTLTGRKKLIQIRPFDFQEFCLAKWLQEFQLNESTIAIYQKLFQEYSLYGWYPKIILTSDPIEKQEIFVDLLNDYLFKDIALLLAEKDIINLKKCLKSLATYTCSMIKLSSLAENIGISRYTLEKYFFVLENTFLFDVIQWFAWKSAPWETKKMTKFYCQDIGFLRFLLGVDEWFGSLKWQMVETFVLNQIMSNKSSTQIVNFWHTKSWLEVDFVLSNQFNWSLLPIEVKSFDNDKIPNSLETFCKYYSSKVKKWVVTTENLSNTKNNIEFLPYIFVNNIL